MSIDKIKKFAVMINTGSGCLVRPDSDEYDYIFTCRHVIEISEEDKNLKNKDSIEIKLYIDEKIERDSIIDIYSNEENDTAILKIKKIKSFVDTLIVHNEYDDNIDYYLIGFPKCRTDSTKKFRGDKLNYTDGSDIEIYFEGQLKNSATYEEIKGFSGGGIIHYDKENDKRYILGIQAKIPSTDESIGRIHFIPIKRYEEIIKENSLSSIKKIEHIISNLSLDVCDFDLRDSIENFESYSCIYNKSNCSFFYVFIKEREVKNNFLKRIESELKYKKFIKTKEIESKVNKMIIFIIILLDETIDIENIFNNINKISSPIFKEVHLVQWFKKISEMKKWILSDQDEKKLKTISKIDYNQNRKILNINKLYIFLNKTINSLKRSPKDLDNFISMLEGNK